MSPLERLVLLLVGLLLVAAVVLLIRNDIGPTAGLKPPGAAAHGRFWWR